MYAPPSIDEHHTWTDWLLKPFSKVHRGEGVQALLLLVGVFAILTAYYLMKTAREGLILSTHLFGLGGAELKSYAGGGMALVLAALVPLYSRLAKRTKRIRLINGSYAVVIACLVGFFALGAMGVNIGLPFFLWIGCVSVFLIGQFWSYCNDLYTEEQGKRLFGMIAIGGSLGAVLGPKLSKLGDTFTLLGIAGGFLVAALLLLNFIELRHRRANDKQESVAEQAIDGNENGFTLIFKDKYILLLAGLMLLTQIVNSNGEFVLSSAATAHAAQVVPASAHADLIGAAHDAAIDHDRREVIKAFYGTQFFWVNFVGFLVQAFLVSRLIQKAGVRVAVFVMPIISLGAYASIGFIGTVGLIKIAKIAENSIDYSLQNTVQQTLFLPTTRAQKYKAKSAIDTFVMRFADTLSAGMVALAVHEFHAGARTFAFVNVGLVIVWLAIAAGIARQHKRISKEHAGAVAAEPAA
ncbi:MAG TPA: hypothetical protein VGM88_08750 [Kofleriaceae bacterium]|jgi:AAA family ATP:ADP antiporter